MSVLLTGATGFIGQQVALSLSREKKDFIGISKYIRLSGVRQVDLTKPFSIPGDFTHVIHLAAKSKLRKREGVDGFFRDNFIGTVNVLEFCRQHDVKRIIFSSSMSVYGKKFSGIIHESTNLHPDSPYSLSKKFAEDAIIQYSQLYGLRYSILRYSSVYGPGQSHRHVLSRIIEKCIYNQEVSLERDSFRNFIFVQDSATATVSCLKMQGNCILNIASKDNTSLMEAALEIKKQLKSDSKILCAKSSENSFKIDTSMAQRRISFKPKYSFTSGISKTINAFKHH